MPAPSFSVLFFAAVILATASNPVCADDRTDFFEKKIRPVLVDHCYECHSAEADEPGGGLLVDSREGLRRGGETGPAVVPKDLKKSLLLSAMEYRDLEMPPDEKLDEKIIADFRRWIRMGAPDPRTGMTAKAEAAGTTNREPEVLWSLPPGMPRTEVRRGSGRKTPDM